LEILIFIISWLIGFFLVRCMQKKPILHSIIYLIITCGSLFCIYSSHSHELPAVLILCGFLVGWTMSIAFDRAIQIRKIRAKK
jgi:hypothetical protein